MAKVKKPLKKGQAKFQLIGEVKINDYTYQIDQESQRSDWIYNRLNLGVDCGNGNVVYADMMGGYGANRDNVVYVHGKKENDNGKMIDDFDNRFTIDWDDRFDENILETIGDMCFIKVGIEKDAKKKTFVKRFLSAYDAIKYIQEHLEDGMVINVKGRLKYSMYNDNIQTNKEIQSIFVSKIDDPSRYRATFTQTVLLDKYSIGKVNKEKKIYPITAYAVDYVGKYDGQEIKESVVFPINLELDIDINNPKNTKKFLAKILKVRKDITEITLEGDIIEGQTLVEITEDDIPDDIKELIEIGAYTKEEAVNKLAVGGNKDKRMVIRRPQIRMAGKDDDRKPVIVKEDKKYTEDDLVRLNDLLLDKAIDEDEDEDEDLPLEPDNNDEEIENEDLDDMSWLDSVGEDE